VETALLPHPTAGDIRTSVVVAVESAAAGAAVKAALAVRVAAVAAAIAVEQLPLLLLLAWLR